MAGQEVGFIFSDLVRRSDRIWTKPKCDTVTAPDFFESYWSNPERSSRYLHR